LEYLDLGWNPHIGDKGAQSLISCVHLIQELELGVCLVGASVQDEMRLQLRLLERDVIYLAFNNLPSLVILGIIRFAVSICSRTINVHSFRELLI